MRASPASRFVRWRSRHARSRRCPSSFSHCPIACQPTWNFDHQHLRQHQQPRFFTLHPLRLAAVRFARCCMLDAFTFGTDCGGLQPAYDPAYHKQQQPRDRLHPPNSFTFNSALRPLWPSLTILRPDAIESTSKPPSDHAVEVSGSGGPPRSGVGDGDGEMPGRLMMDQQGAPYHEDPKKNYGQAVEGGNVSSIDAGGDPRALPATAVNGFANHGGMPNGVVVDDAPRNGKHLDVHERVSKLKMPPSLDQSWRTSDANKPLGKLIARLAQQCYADLHQVLDEMSNTASADPGTQRTAASSQPNAQDQSEASVARKQKLLEFASEQRDRFIKTLILADWGRDEEDIAKLIDLKRTAASSQPNAQDQSEASVARKQKLLEFASEQRDRFIKTLILADWGRDEEDIAKLIDLKVWLDKQRIAHGHAAQDIGQIKIDAIPTKTPNPNLDHALELLSTGKASWIPDLGYLPVKKLSAAQLLKTLRDMNVALATRLNLHDELPPHMKHFSVANGRATFSVLGEFEVDLAVADEDPKSPFFFIDIRFLFSPSTNDLRDQLRGPVESQINSVLGKKGLNACYDLLHNFVLTAKIRTLHEQAERLRSGKWFDCIQVEARRRVVIIQYWTGKPGPKSWLEIGISSGAIPGKRYRIPPTPCISVRWIRAGAEVPTTNLGFDWIQLDVEKCLLAVIAEHTSHLLQTIETRIGTFAPTASSLKTVIVNSNDQTEHKSLQLNLPHLRSPLTLHIESITGKYSIDPPSQQALKTERYLNHNTAADAAALIAALSCATLRTQFEILAGPLNWLPVQDISFTDHVLSTLLKVDVRRHRIVRCHGNWNHDWILLVTFGLHGTAWWIVNVDEKLARSHSGQAISIRSHHQLPTTDVFDKALPLSRASLLRIEKLAAEYISNTVLAQSLIENRIPHAIERPLLTAHSSRSRSSILLAVPTMFVRFSSVMRDEHKTTWKPWAADVMRVTYQGIEQNDDAPEQLAVIQFDLRLSILTGKMKHLQQHLGRKRCSGIAINMTGGLALRLRVPFGHSLLREIGTQLRKLEALDSYVTSLTRNRFSCTTVSLAKIAFQYSSSPPLSAEVLFKNEQSAVLKLEPRDSNPHLRIRLMLEKALNDKSERAFETFTNILSITLPLLQSVNKLLASFPTEPSLVVHVRSPTWYSLKYKPPLQSCAFSIRARASGQQDKRVARWHVQGPHLGPASGSPAPIPEGLTTALKELWQRTDENCLGCGNSIVADAVGIASVLESLDAIVRRFPLAPPPAPKVKESPPPAAAAPAAAKAIKQEPDFITID
nr:mediator of rna polymerase ii transcription subunit 14 [Quercus suber]